MYHNEQIYTQAKKFFKSKDVFTYQDILDWLNENEEEYNKICEGSGICKNCNSRIKHIINYKEDPFACRGNPASEEYKFYNFYETILVLTKYYYENTNAKQKLEEYEEIINDDEKVRAWLIENEEDYYSFWKNNTPLFVSIGSKLLFCFREKDELEYTKFFVEKSAFVHSFDLSSLFDKLYPHGWEVYTYGHIITEKGEKINFKNSNLKIFTEKDTFSLDELSTWLSENKDVETLKSVKHSISERFESMVAEEIRNTLKYNLGDLQELIKQAKFICDFKDNQPTKNMIKAFDLETDKLQIKNKHLLDIVVNEIKETGTYIIHREDWLKIKIKLEEFTPLLKAFDILENSKF